jgi:hypothetical protein
MQRSLHIDLFRSLSATSNELQISCNSSSLLVIHLPSLLIANPRVGSSSSRINPHNVFEAEIIPQSNIDDFYSHRNELPALITDIRFVTTGSDLVVIRQINIETQFLGYGLECSRFA